MSRMSRLRMSGIFLLPLLLAIPAVLYAHAAPDGMGVLFFWYWLPLQMAVWQGGGRQGLLFALLLAGLALPAGPDGAETGARLLLFGQLSCSVWLMCRILRQGRRAAISRAGAGSCRSARAGSGQAGDGPPASPSSGPCTLQRYAD